MALRPTIHRLVPRLLSLFLLVPLSLAAQEDADEGRTLRWPELSVQARLDGEGRLHVRERQTIFFDGAWNGGERTFNLRLGQELRLHGLRRIDPGSGASTALVEGEMERADEYGWTGDETLRWRSRLPSDPPFRNQQLVYELEYTLWPVLVRSSDGGYLLRHDFAFPNRVGDIERFDVDLTLDPAWAGPAGARIRESADRLPPGRGYAVTLPLRYVAAGQPAALPDDTQAWARALAAGGALLVPFLVFMGLRRRARELDRIGPRTPPETIGEGWLRTHIFSHPAELVGASWDRSVGEAEVAALLARLVAEGKLTSRIQTDGKEPVLHLSRVAPLSDFAEPERELLQGLFFAGTEHTDTVSIREHYKEKGFDPASTIRKPLTARLAELPGAGKVKRRWLPAAGVMLAGVVMAVALPGQPGRALVIVLGLLVATIAALFALPFAALLARRVTHRTGPTVLVLMPMAAAAALLALLALGAFEGDSGLLFYHPGETLLVGFLVVLAGLGSLATALSRPTEAAERLAFRRQLVSAREFFEHELDRPEPRLEDAWFPYLLAFGLGPHIDRWFRSFGAQQGSSAATTVLVASGASTGRTSAGSSGGAWSGGGPQFGGGSWGGGGAGGTWSVAAAGMAAGVSAPSSSGGGGGGVSVSGGGGGGGW